MVMDRAYHREYSINYYYKRKKLLLDILGGKCVQCGSQEKLQFDHIEPNNKSFSVGKLLSYSFDLILDELKKCQILCFDCHLNKTRNEGSLKKGNKKHYKLTEEETIRIFEDYKSGLSLREVSAKYKTNRVTIARSFKRMGLLGEIA